MRVALWHGWGLEGSGSNVSSARLADALRAAGHDVLLLCQAEASALPFVDGVGTVSADGVSGIEPTGAAPAEGRLTVLRPLMGSLLPVFVLDEYEGFEVKRFVDLTDDELAGYLRRNADALLAAVEWHGSDVVVAGHAVPGPSVALLALGPGRYVAKVHGSDLEYAVRKQPRLRELAREGLEGATAVTGSEPRTSCAGPSSCSRQSRDRVVVISPGVDPERFRPHLPRRGPPHGDRTPGRRPADRQRPADSAGRGTWRGPWRLGTPRSSIGSRRATTTTLRTRTPADGCARCLPEMIPSSGTSAS